MSELQYLKSCNLLLKNVFAELQSQREDSIALKDKIDKITDQIIKINETNVIISQILKLYIGNTTITSHNNEHTLSSNNKKRVSNNIINNDDFSHKNKKYKKLIFNKLNKL